MTGYVLELSRLCMECSRGVKVRGKDPGVRGKVGRTCEGQDSTGVRGMESERA